MRLGLLNSWVAGVALTVVILALASSPLIFVVLSTIGLPYSVFMLMFDDIFQILGINRASTVALCALPLFAGIACSVFYGALVYFAPFVLDSLRSRKASRRET